MSSSQPIWPEWEKARYFLILLFRLQGKGRLTACGDEARVGGERDGGDGGDVEVIADVGVGGGVVALNERHLGRLAL